MFILGTPWKTNMTMENQPFEDVSLYHGDFPAGHVSYRGVSILNFMWINTPVRASINMRTSGQYGLGLGIEGDIPSPKNAPNPRL